MYKDTVLYSTKPSLLNIFTMKEETGLLSAFHLSLDKDRQKYSMGDRG